MNSETKIRNLTGHGYTVYFEEQFTNLEKLDVTTLVADGVVGEPTISVPSEGNIRMSFVTEELGIDSNGIPAYITLYGAPIGLPTDLVEGDVCITSLKTVNMMHSSGHSMTAFMASPYKVVRLRSDSNVVLGCMGYTH